MCPVFNRQKRRNILAGVKAAPSGKPPVQIAQKATTAAFERTAWRREPKQKPMPEEITKPEEISPRQRRMRTLLTGKPENPKFTKSRFPRKR